MNTYFIVFILMALCGLASAFGPPRSLGAGYSFKRAERDAAESYKRVYSKAEAKKAARRNLLFLLWLVASVALLASLLDGLW